MPFTAVWLGATGAPPPGLGFEGEAGSSSKIQSSSGFSEEGLGSGEGEFVEITAVSVTKLVCGVTRVEVGEGETEVVGVVIAEVGLFFSATGLLFFSGSTLEPFCPARLQAILNNTMA